MAPAEDNFHPHDAVSAAIKGTGVVGAAGLLVSAVQNTLTKSNTTPWGVFTRTGGVILTFGACNLVQKNGICSFSDASQVLLEVPMNLPDLLRPICERRTIA